MEITRTKSVSGAYSEQSALRKIFILTILTALFSFAGWICETVMFLIVRGEFCDRGLLTLPFCPLYGLGMLGVYAVLRTPQSGLWEKICSRPQTKTGRFLATVLCLIVYATLAALLASAVEYITGLFFDRKFGVRLWSYRRYDDTINGYVSLRYSLLWGILAVSAMGLVWHPMQNVLARARTSVLAILAITLFVIIAGDFAFNMIYLHVRGKRFGFLGEMLFRKRA